MKIIDTLIAGTSGREKTVMFLDGDKPSSGWSMVSIEGVGVFPPIFSSDPSENMVAIDGLYEVVGREIDFI